MINYDDIARVLRRLDTESESMKYEEILASIGVSEYGAFRAAQQRALRAYLISRNRELPRASEPVMVQHPAEDEPEILRLATAWIDGFVTGMRLSSVPPDGGQRSGSI